MATILHPVVEMLRSRILAVEPEWSQEMVGGFAWWPGEMCQHVFADTQSRQGDGSTRTRIVIHTDVASLTGSLAESAPTLAALSAGMTTFSGMMLDSRRVLGLHCHFWVSDAMPRAFYEMLRVIIAMQLVEATLYSLELESAGIGKRMVTRHPHSGARDESHNICSLAATVASNSAQGNYANVVDEFSTIEEHFLRQVSCLSASATATDLNAEYSFGAIRSAIHVTTTAKRMVIGNGTLIRNIVPFDTRPAHYEDLLRLNAAEYTSNELNFTGSWLRTDEDIQFITFVPNCLASPGLLASFFSFSVARAQFASVLLANDA